MFIGLRSISKGQHHPFPSRSLLSLLAVLGMLLILACNPFAGDDEEASAVNSEEVVEVNLDRSSQDTSTGDRQPETPQQDQPSSDSGESREVDPVESISELPPAENSEITESAVESPPEETTDNPPLDVGAEEAIDLAWAYLSQCVSLSVSELAARQINGQWFVQAAGENPDLYGVWKVDPLTGSVEAHNIRARQWAPQINSECTQEAFAQFYVATPAPPIGAGITDAEQAVTSLWATLVKCYPTVQTGNLQATLNPARAEWIVTGKAEVTTNYGVWIVRSNGEIVPHNRQAQGIYDQLDNGLC
jgi:hypothetical protein